MSLTTRARWAKRVAIAVRVTKRENGTSMQWVVPSASGASGMEYHRVDRVDGHFRCYLLTPLNPSGITCMGNRVAKAGACRHVMAVCAHEMEQRGCTIQFRHENAQHLHRAGFRLIGEAGSLYVTHRGRE